MFGIRAGTEQPAFQLVARVGQVEIRQYAPRLAASITLPGSEIEARYVGFRRLARYIFGANAKGGEIAMTAPVAQSAKIPMTAPVAQSADTNGMWTISFYMPSTYSLATLPIPEDPGITIHEVPAEMDAVYRFSGIPNAGAIMRAEQILRANLAASTWQITGKPVYWFYDPPWTLPFARRNEVAVPVAPRTP